MIENYIEKDLARKINILNLLWDAPCLTSSDLSSSLKVTSTTIKSDIKNINNNYFTGDQEKLISASLLGYSIQKKELKNKQVYLHNFYKNSIFIRACGYYLINNFKNTEQFSKQEYISNSTAYELRTRSIKFVTNLGIDTTEENSLSNEYKLRFLITYFQINFGLELVSISKYNKYFFENLFNELQRIHGCIFSEYAKQYAYILFQLNFNRNRKSPVKFDGNWLTVLKSSQAYQYFSPTIKKFLSKELHNQFQENEILYYSLVLSLLDKNFHDRSTRLIHYHTCVSLVKNSEFLDFQNLVKKFDNHFQSKISNNSIFEISVIKFLRTCIFNLQLLIPTEQIIGGKTIEVPNNLFYQVKQVLNSWNKENSLGLLFSDDHISQFVYNLISVLKVRQKNKLYIKTNSCLDYLLLKEKIVQDFGKIVTIMPFDPGKCPHNYMKDDLILFEEMDILLENIICKKINISNIFDPVVTSKLYNFLFSYNHLGSAADFNSENESS